MTADEWNRAFEVGTYVDRIMGDGRVVVGRTTHPAVTRPSGLAVVLCEFQFNHQPTFAEHVLLSHLRAAEPSKVPLEGGFDRVVLCKHFKAAVEDGVLTCGGWVCRPCHEAMSR